MPKQSNQLWPIAIPSLGRPDSKLFTKLKAEGTPYTVFVEPQEYDTYAALHESVIDIRRKGLGVWYVRKTIHEYYAALTKWYWSLDDNISGLYQRIDGKYTQCSIAYALRVMQHLNKGTGEFSNVVYMGAENRALAWSNTVDYAFGKKPYACFATRSDAKLRYEKEVNLVEDVASVIRILSSGQQTMQFYSMAFSKPSQGTVKGGNSAEWVDHAIKQKQLLAKENPGVVTLFTNSKGHLKLRVAWRKLSNKYTK